MVSKGDGKAAAIYADSLVWDAHSGFGPSPEVDLSKLAIWKDAGVGYLSIDVGYDVMDWRDTIKSLAYFRRWIMASEDYRLVSSVDEIRTARKAGKMAVTFDLEHVTLRSIRELADEASWRRASEHARASILSMHRPEAA